MQERLLGFWTLASWQTIFRDGSSQAYREEPIGGFLHYASDGMMAVSIFTRQRPQLLSSYGGRYSCEGEQVIHEALEGYSPFGLNEKKVRHLHFEANSLRMETNWIEGGARSFRYQLLWNKQDGAAEPTH